jgi:hypothetical protein
MFTPGPEIRQPRKLSSGLCGSHPHPEWWTADPGQRKERAAAIEVCQRCPLMQRCRDWAVTALPFADIATYGGLAYTERRKLAKAARAAARLAAVPVPDVLIRRLMGILVIAIGALFLGSGLD